MEEIYLNAKKLVYLWREISSVEEFHNIQVLTKPI